MNNMYPMNSISSLGQISPYFNQTAINPVVPTYQPIVQQGPHMEIQRVNGKESAMAYSIGPNSSVILADAVSPKIWVVTTDASGFKAVTGFKIVVDDDEPAEQQTMEEQLKSLSERLDKLEERMSKRGQSNSKSSWQNKSGNANAQSNDWDGQSGEGSDGRHSADER